jgi:hypothetical protein
MLIVRLAAVNTNSSISNTFFIIFVLSVAYSAPGFTTGAFATQSRSSRLHAPVHAQVPSGLVAHVVPQALVPLML